MKLKINKYQTGGGIYSVYSGIYAPTQGAAQQAAPSVSEQPSKSSGEDSLGMKDILKTLLSEGALISDVNKFAKDLSAIEQMPGGLSSNYSSILPIFAKANELIRNVKQRNESVETAYKQGGLNEVAVGNYGEMYVQDENGKISAMTLPEYSKKRDKVHTLTVSELINARENDPSLAYNTKVFSVANNAIGVDKINDKIKTTLSMLGEETSSSDTYRDTKELTAQRAQLAGLPSPTKEQQQGLKDINIFLSQMGNSPEGIYKFTQSKTSNEPHIQAAFKYLWSTLSDAEKNKLKATAVMNGGDISDSQTILLQGLSLGVKTKNEVKSDYQADATNAKYGEAGASGEKGLTEVGNLQRDLTGVTDINGKFAYNDPVTGKQMYLPVTGTFRLYNENKPTGNITLGQFANTQMALGVDMSKGTFGGKPITINDENKIVYDNSMAARMYVPVTDGKPNFELLKRFKQLEEAVKTNHPNYTPEQVNRYYYDHGFGYVKVDVNKNIITTPEMKPFLVFHAYTTDEADVVSNNRNAVEQKDANKSIAEGVIDNVWASNKKSFDDQGIKKPTGTFYTNYYKGLVAYPIVDDADVRLATVEGHGLVRPKTFVETYKEQQLIREGRISPTAGAAGLLNAK